MTALFFPSYKDKKKQEDSASGQIHGYCIRHRKGTWQKLHIDPTGREGVLPSTRNICTLYFLRVSRPTMDKHLLVLANSSLTPPLRSLFENGLILCTSLYCIGKNKFACTITMLTLVVILQTRRRRSYSKMLFTCMLTLGRWNSTKSSPSDQWH